MKGFELAAGTTTGAKHRRGALERNQDAVLTHTTENLLTAVVADGSSSSPRSYVASALQADWFTQLAHEHAATGKPFDESVWDAIAAEIAERIKWNASRSPLPLKAAIRTTWAATLTGVVLGPEFTYLACFGDGRFYLNGELIVVAAAGEINDQPAPAYPCYLVTGTTLPEEALRFQVLTFPTAQVTSAVALTDGHDDYLNAVGKRVPGVEDRIPPPSFIWETDKLYTNTGEGDRWLNFIARDWRMPGNVLAGGRVFDDYSFAAIRRKKTTED